MAFLLTTHHRLLVAVRLNRISPVIWFVKMRARPGAWCRWHSSYSLRVIVSSSSYIGSTAGAGRIRHDSQLVEDDSDE